jgi:hypothetical protein
MDFFSEKEDTKRRSRNLSEKKRRDQFNVLITELGNMVSPGVDSITPFLSLPPSPKKIS